MNILEKIKVIDDRVLVKPKDAVEITAGGLYIPIPSQVRPNQGTVIAFGPGTKDRTMTVEADDQVLYGKGTGQVITIDEQDYLIMKESDILVIL